MQKESGCHLPKEVIQMSKKKVKLTLNNPSINPTIVNYGIITEIRKSCVIVDIANAVQLIPIYRFIIEHDKANLYVGAKVKVNLYYSSNQACKRLLAYNAELTN